MKKTVISALALSVMLGVSGCNNSQLLSSIPGADILNSVPGGQKMAGDLIGSAMNSSIPHWAEAVDVIDSKVDQQDNYNTGKTVYIKGKLSMMMGSDTLMFNDLNKHSPVYIDITGLDKEVRRYISKNVGSAFNEMKAVFETKALKPKGMGVSAQYKAIKFHS